MSPTRTPVMFAAGECHPRLPSSSPPIVAHLPLRTVRPSGGGGPERPGHEHGHPYVSGSGRTCLSQSTLVASSDLGWVETRQRSQRSMSPGRPYTVGQGGERALDLWGRSTEPHAYAVG